MPFQEFINKYLGTIQGYPDGQYIGECLSIVKKYVKEVFGINPPPSGTNSAYGYWSNFPSPLNTVFEKIENTDTLIPEEGWIAIWKPWSTNQYGHIAIVAEGCTTGTLKNYAQNWTSKTFQLESNRYTNVVGFLKPKESIIEDMINEEQKRILDFLQGKTEGQVREAFGCLGDIPNLKKEIESLKVLSQELATKVSDIELKLAEKEKTIVDYQKTVKTANIEIANLKEQVDTLTGEKNNFKKWYEAKCEEVKILDKMTAWQHIRYGIKLFIKK